MPLNRSLPDFFGLKVRQLSDTRWCPAVREDICTFLEIIEVFSPRIVRERETLKLLDIECLKR